MAKEKRRANGEGTLKQRSDGRWEAQLSLPDGKRKSVYGKTRKEVRDALNLARKKLNDGVDLGAPRQTVGVFLERWLEDVVRPQCAPKTYYQYRDLMRGHVIPELGSMPLDKLTAQHIAALLRTKTEAGLSPTTVGHIRSVLRNALNRAVKWSLIARNPAALTDPPRRETQRVIPLKPDEARAALAAARGHRLEALISVGLFLGLRQGEILGLRWVDIDLDVGTLAVTQALQRIDGKLIVKAPKTKKSRRRLTLPASVVAALRAHRDRQAFERQAIGTHWQETGFVFTTTIGTPLDPRNVLRVWHGILAAAGVPRRSFHVTRHTAVSLLIAEGIPLKIIQEVLGHSLLSTTADIYGHLFPQAFTEAAEAMERALGTGS
jgi:integrase